MCSYNTYYSINNLLILYMYYIISNDERIGSGFDTLEEAEEVKNKYMEEDYRDNVLAEYTIEFINE